MPSKKQIAKSLDNTKLNSPEFKKRRNQKKAKDQITRILMGQRDSGQLSMEDYVFLVECGLGGMVRDFKGRTWE
jgi:hypothetical protein